MSRTKSLSQLLWSVMTVTGAACGDDPVNRLPDGPPQTIDVAPNAPQASFAATVASTTTCGELSTTTVDLMISNTGTAELVIEAADATGGFAVESTLPLAIAAGAQAALTIRSPVAVVGTDVGGSIKAGVLTLDTNEPGSPARTAELAATVMGANVLFTNDLGAPIAVDLVTTDGTCPAPLSVFIRNTGNVAVTVTGQGAPNGFALTGFTSGTIEAGASVTQTVAPFALGSCSGTGVVTYQVTGALCNSDGSSASVNLAASYNITGTSSCFCS